MRGQMTISILLGCCYLCCFLLCKVAGEVASSTNRALILSVHKKFRTMEGAANMKAMKYNDQLATLASTVADTCDFDVGTPASPPGRPWKSIGMNIYALSVARVNYTRAAIAWYAEKEYYDFATNRCDEGMLCGHYTQLVWWESTELGCADKICPVLKGSSATDNFFTNATFIICLYAPGGNYKGERPYQSGIECSGCDFWATCVDGLCTE